MKRQIKPAIENYIDQRIGPKLKLPAHLTEPHELHIMALRAMEGIKEVGSNNSGKLVEAIQSTIGTAVKEAWCMSTQQTAIAYVEKKTGTRCLVPVSEHCLTVLNEAQKIGLTVKDPEVGDLIIWQKGDTSSGHVGAIIEDGSELVRTIEGNTGPDKGVTRDGDGIYIKMRSLSGHGDMKVKGFVRVLFQKND